MYRCKDWMLEAVRSKDSGKMVFARGLRAAHIQVNLADSLPPGKTECSAWMLNKKLMTETCLRVLILEHRYPVGCFVWKPQTCSRTERFEHCQLVTTFPLGHLLVVMVMPCLRTDLERA